jgi:hypothetical protein
VWWLRCHPWWAQQQMQWPCSTPSWLMSSSRPGGVVGKCSRWDVISVEVLWKFC